MTRYRTRSAPVDAIRYRPGPGGNCAEVAAFIDDDVEHDDRACTPEQPLEVFTVAGWASALPGDWITRERDGLGLYGDERFHELFEEAS